MQLGEEIQYPCKRGRAAIQLRARIHELTTSLSVTPHTVPLSQREVDLLHGLRVLAHSEIQAFIESVASTILEVTEDNATRGRLTHAGHQLMVHDMADRYFRATAFSRYPTYDTKLIIANFQSDPIPLAEAIKRHKKVVKENNGVKETNVRRLLLPLGYRESFFVPGLLNDLNNFGAARGDVAHGPGSTVGLQHKPSGSTEITRIKKLEHGLEMLERFAPRLLTPL
ncbi:hypothetical protein QRX60_15130 [Amycolatopsis mongoliensis]|uniref:RiboL-PSP-HEPN domain-containing protein n=1 Tax=Amycolatopsis mongoliensis TaxID=715475 RepID=A0A9Y2NHD3_9PSEU|nr:HEPN domain-containing protein [Amycolatopsis sp. 4-36]WIY05102.1 hypothetical protein QRX60_15130 [Amycolatopsis sp. 4-36]